MKPSAASSRPFSSTFWRPLSPLSLPASLRRRFWPLPLLLAALALLAGTAFADSAFAGEAISVCYNYGCLVQSEVVFSKQNLTRVGELLGDARTPEHERALIGVAVGWLLGIAGKQTPIFADRAGNFADDGVEGRMDCIDHSTTTTRLLRLFERHRWLHFHRVLEPARRTRGLIFDHYSAQIEEITPPPMCTSANEAPTVSDDAMSRRYVVDSWYVDNGQPVPVLARQRWQDGEGPDGD
ncbi:hypothetical protein [Rhodocyclus gracilis]|uniref:hypothetical protein n=1 Tax=Rhodocyclus gracilis TaxID=2929842 RepID=UPI001E32CBB7|nr:hypothetical protein [Rhodocyclus gracilis]